MVVTQTVRTPVELLESPCFLTKRLGALVKEKTIAAFEEAGASAFHYAVLAVVDEGVRETQSTIADALGYDPSYLVGVLDELEAGGQLERRRDPADRRRHLVTMTPAGKKQLARLRTIHEQVDHDFFGSLTATEVKTLQRLLAKVAAAKDPRFSV